ncbi:MAG TPA: cation diffusion facilitator family transporter [Acidimicrobiia bacterium]
MAAEGSRKAVVAAFASNTLIAVLKFGAATATGSVAMLAEGFHSVADTGNQVLLLRGMAAAKKPPDVRFPFGRGKEVYFWSFMVAVMLFVGGAVVSFLRGLDAIGGVHEVEVALPSFIVLGLAFVIETFAFRVARRQFNLERGTRRVWRSIRETTDTMTLVVLFEDSAAMVGLGVAATGLALVVVTGNSVWDGVASMTIGLLLALVAVLLAVETKALLIGEAASRADRAALRTAILSLGEVDGVGRLLTMHLGPETLVVNVEVDLHEGLSGAQVEKAILDVESAVRVTEPRAKEISVEVRSISRG